MTGSGRTVVSPMGEVTIYPSEYPRALRNPLMGFRPSLGRPQEWATMARDYIEWNLLEDDARDGVKKIRAVCDARWEGVAARNLKIIPRAYLEWPNNDYSDSRKYWPADMTPGDYTSDQFNCRVVRLIERLGEAWDDDPRVAFIESGLIGYWGEQHSPEPTPAMERLLGDAFTASFRRKLVMVRYPGHFRQYQFGIYWDSWGTLNDTPQMMEYFLTEPYLNRWRTAVMGGEVSYNYGTPPGRDPTDGVVNYVRYIEDLIRRLHWNHLGWIDQYDAQDPDARRNAERLQKSFGYRLVLEKVGYSGRVMPGWPLRVSFSVRNTGSTPLYYNWPVEVSLLDPATKGPVWRATCPNLDVRQWMPGDRWYWPEQRYEIAPELNTVTEHFALPADLPRGRYLLALALLDPAGNLPAARFAITNYFRGGRHPIGYVSVGEEPGDPALDPAGFDDPGAGDSLHYDEQT